MHKDTPHLALSLLLAALYAGQADAELKPISEQEMGDVVGQGIIAVDMVPTATSDFTRFTLGMDVDVQTNVDALVLADHLDALGNPGADVNVSNLSLGHISSDATKIQIDGQTHAEGDIVPFSGIDPYFELAQTSGTLDGFRFGFKQARGTLSGDFASLTGNLGIKLVDDTGAVVDGQLLDASGVATNDRATHFGLAGATTDCAAGVNCTALTNLKTLDVGAANTDGTVGFTEDFFIGVQQNAVTWLTGPDGSGQTVTANPGVFLNIPTAMQLDMTQLQNGIPRARTEFIDRGLGLF